MSGTRTAKLVYKHTPTRRKQVDLGKDGGNNTLEDGRSLDGQYPVSDYDDNEQEVHKSSCTGTRGNADLIKG